MIRINSYLQRDSFSDLLRRWMYGQTHSSDAELITRLVHFNNVYVSRYLQLFSVMVFSKLHGSRLTTRPALTKADLKDVIVANPPHLNKQIEQLLHEYRKHPERFYRETPFHATLFFVPNKNDRYIGSSRIKRVRRLAEKCARRIIDSIFMAIKQRADDSAADRARRLGIPRQNLFTARENMIEEFVKAETKVSEDLRQGNPIRFEREMMINDVAGIKIITEDSDYPRILELLRKLPNCRVIEVEPHTGNYNAINLIICYTPPKDEVLKPPLSEGMLRLVENRGLNPTQANQEFSKFVRSGEDQVHIEVIVSSYQEMLESEIGRCMHEDRIIEQRLKQEYRGHLAKNVEYLMVYLFNSAVSPHKEVNDSPIKLWNRYLPDYFDEVVRGMFDIPPLRLVE